jgi:hypothetical protein
VVLGKEMRLHPVNILFFTLAMASLFGLVGAILAVPAAALVQIVIDEFYLRPRHMDYNRLDREAATLVSGRTEAQPTPEVVPSGPPGAQIRQIKATD